MKCDRCNENDLVSVYALRKVYCPECDSGVFDNIRVFASVFNTENGQLVLDYFESVLCVEQDAGDHGTLAKVEGKRALYWEIKKLVEAGTEIAKG